MENHSRRQSKKPKPEQSVAAPDVAVREGLTVKERIQRINKIEGVRVLGPFDGPLALVWLGDVIDE